MPSNVDTLASLGDRLADDLGTQAEIRLELFKAEFLRDARQLGRRYAPIAMAAPLVALGYGLICVGMALALAPWVGAAGGLLIVGTLNLTVGGLMSRRATRRAGLAPAPYILPWSTAPLPSHLDSHVESMNSVHLGPDVR